MALGGEAGHKPCLALPRHLDTRRDTHGNPSPAGPEPRDEPHPAHLRSRRESGAVPGRGRTPSPECERTVPHRPSTAVVERAAPERAEGQSSAAICSFRNRVLARRPSHRARTHRSPGRMLGWHGHGADARVRRRFRGRQPVRVEPTSPGALRGRHGVRSAGRFHDGIECRRSRRAAGPRGEPRGLLARPKRRHDGRIRRLCAGGRLRRAGWRVRRRRRLQLVLVARHRQPHQLRRREPGPGLPRMGWKALSDGGGVGEGRARDQRAHVSLGRSHTHLPGSGDERCRGRWARMRHRHHVAGRLEAGRHLPMERSISRETSRTG